MGLVLPPRPPMTPPFRLLLAALLATLAPAGRAADGTLVDDSTIDARAHNFPFASFSVATVHGVTFQQDGLTTHRGWQYAAYYQGNLSNSVGKVAVARRPLPHGDWQTLVLDDYSFTTVDSHNDVVLGICAADGTLHLSFDHHVNDLNYRVSVPGVVDDPESVVWSPALFGPVVDRLAGPAVMTQVTYPRFIPTPDGKLLFTYRSGSSGGGDEVLYEYDGGTRAWSLVGQYTTRSGTYTGTFASGSDRNGYFDNTLFDRNGRLHATWCWRETPNASSNHDLLYAYSDDAGRTWKNQASSTISVAGSSFISVASPGIIAWPIPQSRNYINNSAMTVDAAGRVHVVAWHLPAAAPDMAFTTSLSSPSRFIHYWRGTDGVWRKNETTLTGTRAKLHADDDGRLFLAYGDATNIRIAAADPAADPESNPTNSWNNWAALNLSGALPAGRANTINLITDTARWDQDRILSIYAQETNPSGTPPSPLHVLDYHVSRAAVLPQPTDAAADTGPAPLLSWTAGQTAVAHDVYFGTSAAAIAAATPVSPEYVGRLSATSLARGPLPASTVHYWRVDAVDAAGTATRGRVWSFDTGSLLPAIGQGAAVRSYGGRSTFPVTVDLKDPALATGDVVLHYGTTDGGGDPAAWEHTVDFGPRGPGSHSLVLDGLPAGTLRYGFRITTVHGSSWATGSGLLAPAEDLALWSRSAPLQVDGYTGAGTLADFPVLVRLSSALVPGFDPAEMLSPPHGDLRFSTPDGRILAHEVERWDPFGTSLVWVKLPALSAGTSFRVWWGRAGVGAPPTRPTWSAFQGVWHLDPALGLATDSSTHEHAATATSVAAATDGATPGAGSFAGSPSAIAIDNAPALNPAHITVEAWVRTTAGGTLSIFNKDQSAGGTARVWQFRVEAGKLQFLPFNANANATVVSAANVNDGQLHHVCGTWDGTTARVYVDGVLSGSAAFSGSLRAGQNNRAFIGRGENASANHFIGTLDEVRLSPVARTVDWIRASWDSQKPAATFLGGAPAEAPDLDGDLLPDLWETSYFATTFGSDPDPDRDGLENLLEFALGGDPVAGGDPPQTALLPATGGGAIEFVYPQRSGGGGAVGSSYSAAGLRYAVEFSADLSVWHQGPAVLAWSGRREALPDGMERVGVHLTDPVLAAAPQVFARLRVTPAE